MSRKIIGLWSGFGAGKSTTARILCERHAFVEHSFAAPLKSLAGDLFMFSDVQLYGPSEMRNVADPRGADRTYWTGVRQRADRMMGEIVELFAACPEPIAPSTIAQQLSRVLSDLQSLGAAFTPRAALQQLGTEFGRELWPRLWLHHVFRRIVEESRSVVLSDARFSNEAELIHTLNGLVAWIDASKRIHRTGEFAHPSEATFEQAKPFCHFVLDNNGSPADLERNIGVMLDTTWNDRRLLA